MQEILALPFKVTAPQINKRLELNIGTIYKVDVAYFHTAFGSHLMKDLLQSITLGFLMEMLSISYLQ